MALVNVLYTKIFNNEDKENGALFVAPKARGGGSLVVPLCAEASFEELVGEHTVLG